MYAGRFHGNPALFIYGEHHCLVHTDKYQSVWFLAKPGSWETVQSQEALVTIRVYLRENGWEKTSEVQIYNGPWDYWEKKRP